MKWIDKKDYRWHSIENEMPSITTRVQLRDSNGIIYDNREIVIEMSGCFIYRWEEQTGWENKDWYKEWRFDSRYNFCTGFGHSQPVELCKCCWRYIRNTSIPAMSWTDARYDPFKNTCQRYRPK